MYSYSYLTIPHAARCDYCGVRLTDTTHTDSYKLNSGSDITFFFCLSANVETAGGEEPFETATKIFLSFLFSHRRNF